MDYEKPNYDKTDEPKGVELYAPGPAVAIVAMIAAGAMTATFAKL
mgnify:CR=1 FL=1